MCKPSVLSHAATHTATVGRLHMQRLRAGQTDRHRGRSEKGGVHVCVLHMCQRKGLVCGAKFQRGEICWCAVRSGVSEPCCVVQSSHNSSDGDSYQVIAIGDTQRNRYTHICVHGEWRRTHFCLLCVCVDVSGCVCRVV